MIVAANRLNVFALAAWTVVLAAGPERWDWAAAVLYLPQWFWALPALLLFPAALLRMPGAVWQRVRMPVAALLWVAGPVMGLCLPFGRASSPNGLRLRVMSYNIDTGDGDEAAVIEEIARTNPDILLVQDRGASFERGPLGIFLKDWHTRVAGQYLVAALAPVAGIEYATFPDAAGGEGYLRCDVLFGRRRLTVYDTHLATPRRSLLSLRRRGGLENVESNARRRLEQAAILASRVARERGAFLVAGDFNAPLAGLVCREFLDLGLRDAFSEAGFGYGYTFGHTLPLRHSFLRIDHIFASRGIGLVECRTGTAGGSDHRPVIADIVLP